jgi:hypothetical protein
MKKLLIALICLVILLILIFLISTRFYVTVTVPPSQVPPANPPVVACTMDAKICPDGSAVGRIPPSCQFAACPATQTPPVSSSGPITVTVSLGQQAGGLRATITPLEVLEDSRCPVNANCIWAGTVRLRVSIASGSGASQDTIVLNTPITTESHVITLTEVGPQAIAGEEKDPSKYKFTFTISKR